MKSLLLAFLFVPCLVNGQEALLANVREQIAMAFQEEEVSESLNKQFDEFEHFGQPILNGYKGALLMAKSKHALNPFKKLSNFNKGKEILESALAKAYQNIELRFLRLTIQVNVPGFLGYNENINEDIEYIESNLIFMENLELRDKMNDFITKARKEGKLE